MVLMKKCSEPESFRTLPLLLCFGLLWVFGCTYAEKEYRPIAQLNDGRFEVKSFTINGVGPDDELIVKLGSQMEVVLNLFYKNENDGMKPHFRFYTQLQEDRRTLKAGSAGTTMKSGHLDQPFSKGERSYRFNVTVPDHESIVEICESLHGGRFMYFAITHRGYLVASRRIDFTE